MQTCNPLQARSWFNLRAPVNWGISVLVFVPLVFVLQNLLPFLLADTIAIVLIFCLFFFYLHKRAIAIKCPHCDKYIQTNTPWVCGVCGTQNLRVDDFPFVNRCGNKQCGSAPKSYLCHHLDCRKLIFLTPDNSPINYAQRVNMPSFEKPARKKPEKSENEFSKLERGIQLGKLQVAKARIDVELKGLNENLQPPKPRKQKDIIAESFDDYFDRNMSGAEIVRRKKAEIAIKYKDDPAELERQNLLIDQWAKEHLDLM
jgi:hypothetical protein